MGSTLSCECEWTEPQTTSNPAATQAFLKEAQRQSEESNRPRHRKAEQGWFTATFQRALANGADINGRAASKFQQDAGLTALHFVARGGRPDLVRWLLTRGADINARASDCGSTPLVFAVIAEDVEVVRSLMEAQADAEIATTTGNKPIHIARRIANPEIIELLTPKLVLQVLPFGESFDDDDESHTDGPRLSIRSLDGTIAIAIRARTIAAVQKAITAQAGLPSSNIRLERRDGGQILHTCDLPLIGIYSGPSLIRI